MARWFQKLFKDFSVYILALALVFTVFYLNFSNFYSLVFSLDPDNFDVLEYFWTLSDNAILLISIGFLFVFLLTALVVIIWDIIEKYFNLERKIYSLVFTCRSPPLK
ncbi:MAG: hypothetical protein KatS3mg095_0985 [Candidatus Parcubacteria bacterium]|nr:MAG: hypothetical protein KatS3mg095_0985 [Candidatus Parcubacteria bacterium]